MANDSCISDEMCSGFGTGCIGGVCQKGTMEGHPCAKQSCDQPLFCVDGVCRRECFFTTKSCKEHPISKKFFGVGYNSSQPWDCFDIHKYALNGACHDRISEGQDCPSSFEGHTHVCKDGLICHKAKCRYRCFEDSHCLNESTVCEKATSEGQFGGCAPGTRKPTSSKDPGKNGGIGDGGKDELGTSPLFYGGIGVLSFAVLLAFITCFWMIFTRKKRKTSAISKEKSGQLPSSESNEPKALDPEEKIEEDAKYDAKYDEVQIMDYQDINEKGGVNDLKMDSHPSENFGELPEYIATGQDKTNFNEKNDPNFPKFNDENDEKSE